MRLWGLEKKTIGEWEVHGEIFIEAQIPRKGNEMIGGEGSDRNWED